MNIKIREIIVASKAVVARVKAEIGFLTNVFARFISSEAKFYGKRAFELTGPVGRLTHKGLLILGAFLKRQFSLLGAFTHRQLVKLRIYTGKQLNVFRLYMIAQLTELRLFAKAQFCRFGKFLLAQLFRLRSFLVGQLNNLGRFLWRHRKPTGLIATTLFIIVWAAISFVDSITVYEYSVQGHVLGAVSDREVVLDSVDKIVSEPAYGSGAKPVIDKDKDVTFKKVISTDIRVLDEQAQVMSHVAAIEDLKVRAYGISVDNVKYGNFADSESAADLLNRIKVFLLGTDDLSRFKSIEWIENVEITEGEINKNELQDTDAVYNELLKGVLEVKTYVVKKGDTIYDIAVGNDVTEDELEAWNPDLDPTIIHIGDEIKLQEEKSLINIKAVETKTYEAEEEFQVNYEDTATMYQGEEKILVPGVKGVKEVVGEIVYINGKESERIEISSRTIQPSSPQTVQRGTRPVPPKEGTGSYIYPVRGRFTSGFGYRWGYLHAGIDLALPRGNTVVASDGGTIVSAGWSPGLGYTVVINHGQGMTTLYGHNSKVLVSAGDRVFQGDPIALSGNTGNSTGPHVHFEIRKFGVAQNPLDYL